ncbi:MAG TPA: glutamyl-tRNA reductase [Verrucomicrobiae bacterium]|jgi:glutamyl-tRNA reductase|nr:glutamyl-tRNA reductase [Verrucomicrobiae bacterium]
MIPFVVGLSFKTAPIALRERLAVPPAQLADVGRQLKLRGRLAEAVLVSTCNRVELYGATDSPEGLEELLASLAPGEADIPTHAYHRTGAAAARHLFAVASGLESLALGETEITGQIKQAYESAVQAGLTGCVTHRLFQKAFQTVKAIRSQTHIGRGATSVGSVAVQLAEKIFGASFENKTVMIIGAGKMGEACVKHLAKKGAANLIVANRSLDHAQALAHEVGGRAVNYMDDGLTAMRESDIVISSTGCPTTILDREDVAAVMRYRPHRPLVLIDIAAPRDIAEDAQKVENVFLWNIDDLEVIARENLRLRQAELETCQTLIDQHATELMAKLGAPARQPHGLFFAKELAVCAERP